MLPINSAYCVSERLVYSIVLQRTNFLMMGAVLGDIEDFAFCNVVVSV